MSMSNAQVKKGYAILIDFLEALLVDILELKHKKKKASNIEHTFFSSQVPKQKSNTLLHACMLAKY